MSFWENMTVGQMGQLMLSKEQAVREDWLNWSRSLARKPNGSAFSQEEKKTSYLCLNALPVAPAGYFLTYVAVICARASEKTGPSFAPSMDKIGESYLNHTLESVKRIDGWKFGLSLFIKVNQEDRTEEERAFVCWEHILERLKNKSDEFTPELSLSALMEKVLEANEEYYQQKKEWRINEQSIAYFTQTLEQKMCRKYCAAAPQMAPPAEAPFPNSKQSQALCRLVEGGAKQIILTGAPGTGKTRTAGLVARFLGTSLSEYAADPEHPYPLVQFHPSYDYTDFVEGLRPVELEGQDGSAARFVKLDGSFKAFCRNVAQANEVHTRNPKNDPDRQYFFIIDEINRADLSKVFGELMFCLEADKRGHPVQTQYRNLPTYRVDETTRLAAPLPREEDVFANGFFIPENVIILGTMNDIDRSVESMDFALYRRFEWREVKVDEELLVNAFQSGGFDPVLKERAGEAAVLVMQLNSVISGGEDGQGGQFGLNRHYYISQGQFAHLPKGKFTQLEELMQYVWDRRISFLLREYVRGEDNPDVTSFLSKCAAALGVEPDEQERES